MTQQPWVAIDTSRQGEVRLALAYPGAERRLEAITTYDTATLPTFTDALMRFQTDTGIALHTADAALAIAGAVIGSAIPIARSRWTISRSGLSAMFRRPPAIINDVAARAWALRDVATRIRPLRGSGAPDLAQPGRYILLTLDEGVGCATVNIDADGEIRILECEPGHLDFAAADAAEQGLATVLGHGMPASWEQVLMLDRTDPALIAAAPGLTEAERGRMLARLAGRFTVNALLASGAWNGALLTGTHAARLLGGDLIAAFDGSFLHRRSYRRVIAATPCWLVEQPDPVLTGLAALIARHQRPGEP